MQLQLMRAEEHSALESMELNKSIKIKWDFTIKNKEFFFIVNHRLNSYFDPTNRLLSVFDFNKMEKKPAFKKNGNVRKICSFFLHWWILANEKREKKSIECQPIHFEFQPFIGPIFKCEKCDLCQFCIWKIHFISGLNIPNVMDCSGPIVTGYKAVDVHFIYFTMLY